MQLESERLSNLALTYANDVIMDGAGAQLHRIYTIYALSRHLGVSYFHSPLFELGYQGLTALEKNERDSKIVERYNTLFALPSDGVVPENAVVHYLMNANFDFINDLKKKAQHSNVFHLVKMVFTHPAADHFPQMLSHLKTVSPFEVAASPVFRIAIHVRRGDLFIADVERALPNSYYMILLQEIIKTLRRLGISFVCELYTELPSAPFIVTPGHHGMATRIKKDIMIAPEANDIKEFDQLPHLKKCINGDPIETLRAMATADLLMMSRSDFSYTAAILNKKGIIVYHPFWHGTPMEWLDGNHQRSFSERLFEACSRWLKERQS